MKKKILPQNLLIILLSNNEEEENSVQIHFNTLDDNNQDINEGEKNWMMTILIIFKLYLVFFKLKTHLKLIKIFLFLLNTFFLSFNITSFV